MRRPVALKQGRPSSRSAVFFLPHSRNSLSPESFLNHTCETANQRAVRFFPHHPNPLPFSPSLKRDAGRDQPPLQSRPPGIEDGVPSSFFPPWTDVHHGCVLSFVLPCSVFGTPDSENPSVFFFISRTPRCVIPLFSSPPKKKRTP